MPICFSSVASLGKTSLVSHRAKGRPLASIGDGCTLLHGVTLGTTGDLENTFDRHPKIGKNVLIGANASVLGNIRVGDNAKIGAGSVVLQPVPGGATVVGVPAKQVAQ